MGEKSTITCKLTDEIGKGAKAHIIPRSFYNLKKDDPLILFDESHPYKKQRIRQAGEYDDKIVTEAGEKYFSSWDDYAYELLVEKKITPITHKFDNETAFLEYKDIDYNKLKLFFISLLWRSGVTTNPLFQEVNLGHKHEGKLKKMILEGDAGTTTDYSVVIARHQDTPKEGHPIVSPAPMRISGTGVKYYKFYLGHCTCMIKVDKRSFPDVLHNDFALAPNRPLIVIIVDRFSSTRLASDILRKVKRIDPKWFNKTTGNS